VPGTEQEETLDVATAVDALQRAQALQHRSALSFALAAASLTGLEHQHLADRLWAFAQEELDDLRRLVEKIIALEGEPTTELPPLDWTAQPDGMLDRLIEQEREALEAVLAVIEPTGREAASEAIEHRMEHIIMRKQEQVDFLVRARGASGG
jgi:bacterioferritin (cytochrome b1)